MAKIETKKEAIQAAKDISKENPKTASDYMKY